MTDFLGLGLGDSRAWFRAGLRMYIFQVEESGFSAA